MIECNLADLDSGNWNRPICSAFTPDAFLYPCILRQINVQTPEIFRSAIFRSV